MKLLFVIPHFYHPGGTEGSLNVGGGYSSVGPDKTPKIDALRGCLTALLANFGSAEFTYEHSDRMHRRSLTNADEKSLDILIVSNPAHHVVDELGLPESAYEHFLLDVEPAQLGFECHRILGEKHGLYDYYCYLEDDIIINDPLCFQKLDWFSRIFGEHRLLQPNRYELTGVMTGNPQKHFIDFTYESPLLRNESFMHAQYGGQISVQSFPKKGIAFAKAPNPHSGCFFLNNAQLSVFMRGNIFPDRDSRLFNPMDSAATLGIVKCFHVYKAAPPNMNFFEVLHYGESWSRKIMSVTFR